MSVVIHSFSLILALCMVLLLCDLCLCYACVVGMYFLFFVACVVPRLWVIPGLFHGGVVGGALSLALSYALVDTGF